MKNETSVKVLMTIACIWASYLLNIPVMLMLVLVFLVWH